MKTNGLSTCFCTTEVDACRDYYKTYFAAKAIFDCGWYVILKINQGGPELCFIQPQENMPVFDGKGVMLNFIVDDVDTEYSRLTSAGLEVAMPLEDHPWGDRGFSVLDPIGNSVYIYSPREPSSEFKRFFND